MLSAKCYIITNIIRLLAIQHNAKELYRGTAAKIIMGKNLMPENLPPDIEGSPLEELFPTLIICPDKGSLLHFNKACSTYLEIKSDFFPIGTHCSTFWADAEDFSSFIDTFNNSKKVQNHYAHFRTLSRQNKHALLNAAPISFNDKSGIYITITDITPLVKEPSRPSSNKNYLEFFSLLQLLSNTVPIMLWAKDINNRFLFANRAMKKELLQCEVFESPFGHDDLFFAEREKEKGYKHTIGETCLNSDEIVKKEQRTMRFLEEGYIHNTYTYLDVHKSPFFDKDGTLMGTIGAALNITQNIAVQNRLKTKEKQFQIIANNVRDVIWITDHNLTITFLTPSIYNLTGHTVAQFMKIPKEKFCYENFKHSAKAISRYLAKQVRKGELSTHVWEFEWIHRDGHTLWIETSASPIFDSSGAFSGFVCASRETTEKVQEQSELKKKQEEALIANKAKSQFLANMSHEIRTPLNGVLGMLQLLENTHLDDEQKNYVRTAMSSGDSLLKIISDILDFSKIEAQKIDLEYHPFSIQKTVNSTIRNFQYLIENPGVKLCATIAEELPEWVYGDETRFRQILFNLLGNAIKFTDSGTIQLNVSHTTTTDKKTDVLVEVKDSGIGIAKEKIDTLFDPFVQVDDSVKHKYPGTGLGLSIVKKLVDIMGGDITITSELGSGTRVVFSVPFTICNNLSDVPNYGEAPPALVNTTRSLKILIVEDERINAMVISSMLTKLGHTAVHKENGDQALEALEKEPFDCVLMDIQMPYKDGIETTKAIRKNICGNCSTIPIIALTAHAMKGDRERFMEAGMNNYLTKPVKFEQLTSALQSIQAEKES